MGVSTISQIDHMVLENQVIQDNSFSSPRHDFDESSIDITENPPNASPTNTLGLTSRIDCQTSAKAKGKKHKVLNDEIHGTEIKKVHLAIK